MVKKASAHGAAEQRLSIAQIAELWRCSRQHVYDLLRLGVIPPPDTFIGDLPGWKLATVTECGKRTLRGRGYPRLVKGTAGTLRAREDAPK